jgi:hypothetical protein
MSTLAMEVDATLGKLDPPTAAKLTRLVRDALALARPDEKVETELTEDYFEDVIGGYVDLEFERPTQGELPATKVW